MTVDDPQLLQARPRDQWRPGHAIEVLSSGSKWSVGVITAQDGGTLHIILRDKLHCQVAQNDSALASIGRHIRELPPGWEIRRGSPPHLAPVGSHVRRGYQTLEDAWTVYMEQQVPRVKAPRARPDGPPQTKGGPLPPQNAKAAASNGVHFQVQPEIMQIEANAAMGGDELAARLHEAELRLEECQQQIQRLVAENGRLREERDELRAEAARLHSLAHRSVSQASLPTSPSQRLLVTSPLPLQPSNSSGFIKNETSGVPPMPNSWQPPTSARETPGRSTLSPVSADGDGEEGDMFPGPDFNCNNFRSSQPLATMASVPAAAPPPSRMSEKPVEIVVSVPRAVDEFEAPLILPGPGPSRSLQSLQNVHVPLIQHQVTRLPSAPVPQSQAFAVGPLPAGVQVACGNSMYVRRNLAPMERLLPSAPASLAAPAGGVRVVRPLAPSAAGSVPVQQACVSVAGYR